MALPSVNWSDVAALYPSLGSLPVQTQDAILARVNREVRSADLGDAAFDAKIELAAHAAELHLAGSTGGAGPITSKSVDGVSVTYAGSFTAEALKSTRHGLEYLRILESVPGLRMLRVC